MRSLAVLLVLCAGSLRGGIPLQVFRGGDPALLASAIEPTGRCPEDVGALAAILVRPLQAEWTAEGYETAFPPTAVLTNVALVDERLTLVLSLSTEDLAALTPLQVDAINFQVVSTVHPLGCARFFDIRALDPADGRSKPLSFFLREPPLAHKEHVEEAILRGYAPPAEGQPQPAGSLSGKTVFLSAGHGWYWTGASWTTQRGVNCDIVEDFENAEGVNFFLARYLANAGAKVVTARERDMGTDQVIVDNGGGNGASSYAETGTWTNSSLAGFAQGNSPYASGTNPFGTGGNRLAQTVAGAATAWATWVPAIPTEGDYSVYVAFSSYSSRATDAHYAVRHTGGVTHFRVNQQIDGFTWRYLGTFHFREGTDAAAGAVTLFNDSSTAGAYVSADAVRFGGGVGEITRSGVSGKPKWEECCRYWAQYQGAPSTVYDASSADNSDDVTCRPRYSEWEKDAGEDGVFISWHSNAATGGCSTSSGRGTDTFIHSTAPSPGSAALQDAIHPELINDIRAEWDAAWTDRGQQTADFGEVRLLSTMPGVLIEMAFHDHPTDAAALKHPRFKQLVARAVYQGICKYYNPTATLLPEPPTHLWVKNLGGGTVRLGWRAPVAGGAGGHAATGYRIYRSADGFGFADAAEATGTTTDLSGLVEGELIFLRVASTNAGGESFPTETLAVRVGAPTVLLVNGFDRMDSSNLVWKSDTVGNNLRMVLDRMNAFNYSIEHAQSLAVRGTAFDGASNEAVRDGDLALAAYCAVDWISGEESTADDSFDTAEQAVLQVYLSGGGNLFVSGSEIGWDLDAMNNGRAFYNGFLKADYLYDDPYTGVQDNIVDGEVGGIFDGLSGVAFDNGMGSVYNVDYPDVIGGSDGSIVNMNYAGADTAAISAGIQFDGSFKVVNLGFPFESILDAADRDAVMDRVMDFLTAGCGADETAPAPVGDSLRWNGALGRWEWTAVAQDRFGGPETVAAYRVRRSTDPAVEGAVAAAPAAPNWPDASAPSAGACWFYQVTAVDAAGNEGEPFRYALRDNPHAAFAGVWNTGTTAPGHYGDDYRWVDTGGTGSKTAVWSHFCRETGDHAVALYYPQGGNRSTASRFTVTHAGGSTLYTVNQQINGGAWWTLGTHRLQAGQTYTVTLDDAEAPGAVVIADAVQWSK